VLRDKNGERNALSKQEVHEKYDYVPIEKARPLISRYDSPRSKRGDPVGHLARRHDSYVTPVHGKTYLVHRLVWLWKDKATYTYGEVPKMLDHINRDHHDNRYENLRPVASSHNGVNSKLSDYEKTSMYRGVCMKKDRGKWTAQLGGKTIGEFDDEVTAALAYDRAAYQKYGELNALNFPENKRNYLGLDHHEQLEFSLFKNCDVQQTLDLSDVILIR